MADLYLAHEMHLRGSGDVRAVAWAAVVVSGVDAIGHRKIHHLVVCRMVSDLIDAITEAIVGDKFWRVTVGVGTP